MKAAIIGCGKRSAGFAEACVAAGNVEFVGFADPLEGAAQRLVDQFGGRAFVDTREMLSATRPEFVCIVTRPSVRLEPIQACAEAGVRGVHCEKPMSTSWQEAKAIQSCVDQHGVKVTFSHQRRLLGKFQKAREMIRGGVLGKIERIEGHCDNMYDWGTHWFDMMFFLNEQVPADWVLAQVDRTSPKFVFDQPMDTCGVSVVHFTNGVLGMMQTGRAHSVGCRIRVLGEHGMLDIPPSADQPLRLLRNGWEVVDAPGVCEGPGSVKAGTLDAIAALRAGRVSLLDSANALMATELVFATYASAVTGGTVPLPLERDLSLRDTFGA